MFSSLIVIPSNNVPYNVDTLWLCRGGRCDGGGGPLDTRVSSSYGPLKEHSPARNQLPWKTHEKTQKTLKTLS